MKRELRSKWDLNDKVGSLQIAIQACKLLHDTSNAVRIIIKIEISRVKICLRYGDHRIIWNQCF
jgi:hypothetical protein